MKLIAAAHSDRGKVRSENQDSYSCDTNAGLFLIADGMGGRAAGKRASAEGTRVIVEEVARASAGVEAGARLATAVERANAHVWRLAQGDPALHGMGTTVAALLVEGTTGFLAHVGDSRIYRVRDGRIDVLTRDHSYAAELAGQGVEVPDARTRARFDSMLTRAVGAEEAVEVEVTRHDIVAGDVFLLCSDGVYRMVEPRDLLALVTSGQRDLAATCAAIIDHANAAGGRDNATVILVRAEDGAPA